MDELSKIQKGLDDALRVIKAMEEIGEIAKPGTKEFEELPKTILRVLLTHSSGDRNLFRLMVAHFLLHSVRDAFVDGKTPSLDEYVTLRRATALMLNIYHEGMLYIAKKELENNDNHIYQA